MQLEYSMHWQLKRRRRPSITDDCIEYYIQQSTIINDKLWEDVYNAIAVVPSTGRTLKVAYKRKGKAIKVLTAYWLN